MLVNYEPAETILPNESCSICGKKYGTFDIPQALGWITWEEKYKGLENNTYITIKKMSISGHKKCLEESRIEPTNTKTD